MCFGTLVPAGRPPGCSGVWQEGAGKRGARMAEPLVTFDLRHGRIVIGGNGDELAKLFKLAQPTGSEKDETTNSASQSSPTDKASTTIDTSNGQKSSVRRFARRFSHRKLYERVVILLYYATRVEGRTNATTRELHDWFGLCGFKTPTRMDKALENVKQRGRFVERTGPGQWTLTTAGENVALEILESPEANGSE